MRAAGPVINPLDSSSSSAGEGISEENKTFHALRVPGLIHYSKIAKWTEIFQALSRKQVLMRRAQVEKLMVVVLEPFWVAELLIFSRENAIFPIQATQYFLRYTSLQ